MKLPWGTTIAMGIFIGAILGMLTDKVVDFIFLGAALGIVGEIMRSEDSSGD